MDENYQNLANAIILLAAKDYRAALRRIMKDPENRMAGEEVKKLERFFRSGWYEMLTDVDGEYLMNRIRREEEEKQSQNKSIRGKKKQNGGLGK